jgi:hypothetical protein
MERSPLEYSYGFFIADAPGHGGAQCFCWFETEAHALAHLRDELWLLYSPEDKCDDDDEEGQDELQIALRNILADVARLKDIPRGQVNSAAEGLFKLRWAGSFSDLEFGKERFEKEIQQDFRDGFFPDERGQTESDSDDFAQHLLNYHG